MDYLEAYKLDARLNNLRNMGAVIAGWMVGSVVTYWDSWQAVTSWWWAW